MSFNPDQPQDKLRQSLGALDLHLEMLKSRMEGLVLPSKICGVLAAGRPVAFVGDTDGEIARFIREHEIGIAVGHGEGAELAEQVQALSRDPERLRRMGAKARALFDRRFAKPLAIGRWKRLLEGMVAKEG